MKIGDIEISEDVYYTTDHEWALIEEGGFVKVGTSDYAQKMLHEIVFVQLPEKDAQFNQKDILGSMESTKAVADVYSPVAGQVVEVNEALTESPELINQDPYGKGWFARLKPANIKELENLMKAGKYVQFVKELLEKEKEAK